MSENLFERKLLFFNIMPYSPGDEKKLAAEAIDYYKQTGNDLVLYCMTLHPEGFPAMNKAERMLKSYQLLKAELEGTGVRLGVLIQSILGHWPRVDKDEEPWTRSINIDGKFTRFCTLDPNFRKYIFDVTVMFAKEKPVFMLGDDDIRSFALGAPECFCERHTAKFNEMTNCHFTPDEYRQAVKDSSCGDKVFNAFETLRQAISTDTATIIREAIDSVDPSIPAGTCMPGWERRLSADSAKCIAAKNQPLVMRTGNTFYLESSAKLFPYIVAKTMAYVEFHKQIPYLLDEADSFPHHLYSKSAKSMHAKLYAVIFSGLRGAKLWYVNASKFGFPIHKNYTKILGKFHNSYDVLAGVVAQTRLSGVIIPASNYFPDWHTGHPDRARENFTEEPTVGTKILGVTGIPFQCSFDLEKDQIYALAGEKTVSRFTDDDLKKLLSRKLFVDGPAAAALCARGFEKYLGVRAELIDFRFNRETNVKTNAFYQISKTPGVPKLTLLDDKAEVMTELGYGAYSGAPIESVAPGTVFYRNELGGYVCTSAYHQDITYAQLLESRNKWYIDILDKLNGSKLPVVCTEQQEVMLLTREYADGKQLLLITNLNFDDLEEIKFRFAVTPAGISRLTPEGNWEKVNFQCQGDEVIISRSLKCYDTEIFKLN